MATLSSGLVLLSLFVVVPATTTYLQQSFKFSWDPIPGALTLPVTEQCSPLNITWGRQDASGPEPVAPYVLQVYTSASLVPFVIPAGAGPSFEWTVPFTAGTMFQVCMFDSKGNSGGCQQMITTIEAPFDTTSPLCTDPTSTLGGLDIEGVTDHGALSQYDSIHQCSDLALTPRNGTPPYILTIASALRSPWNISSPDKSTVNWTVALNWGSPFFVSMVDSAGNAWANGPLHAGESNDTSCLTLGGASHGNEIASLAIGLSLGIGGLLMGALLAFILIRRQWRYPRKGTSLNLNDSKIDLPYRRGTADYAAVPNPDERSSFDWTKVFGTDTHYRVDPFVLPPIDDVARSPARHSSPCGSPTHHVIPSHYGSSSTGYETPTMQHGSPIPNVPPLDSPRRHHASSSSTSLPFQERRGVSTVSGVTSPSHYPDQSYSSTAPLLPRSPSLEQQLESTSLIPPHQQVYVVHHDAGKAPVTVYSAIGAEVVELPPHYAEGAAASRRERSASGSNKSGNKERPPGLATAPRSDKSRLSMIHLDS